MRAAVTHLISPFISRAAPQQAVGGLNGGGGETEGGKGRLDNETERDGGQKISNQLGKAMYILNEQVAKHSMGILFHFISPFIL